MNDRIEKQNYCFLDILNEGIIIHDSGNCKLSEPKELSPTERQAKAQEEFDHWFESANGFFKTFHFNFQENDYKLAIFQLHQYDYHII